MISAKSYGLIRLGLLEEGIHELGLPVGLAKSLIRLVLLRGISGRRAGCSGVVSRGLEVRDLVLFRRRIGAR